ncbi:MAG TPA: hypothetical protein PKX87_04300, partial [Alphaproteobacteria bacterium]|nr:hypothetical protein [Alphaproteobacteria bacterium]
IRAGVVPLVIWKSKPAEGIEPPNFVDALCPSAILVPLPSMPVFVSLGSHNSFSPERQEIFL